jgi:hypothetical protein
MIDLINRAAWLAAYQFSLLVALVMLPVAVLVRQGGLTLPLGRLVERTGRAYAAARDGH